MITISKGRPAHPARWLLALTLGAALAAAPALPAHAAATPVAVDDAYSTTQSTTMISAQSILANDTMGDARTFSPVSFPKHGQARNLDTPTLGTVQYTPEPGFSGTDTFQYCLSGSIIGGPCVSNVATITITVLAAVPVDDQFDTFASTALTIKKIEALANDLNTNPAYLSWNFHVEGPKNGTLVQSGLDSFVYTPSPGFAGADSIKYCLTELVNGSCQSASATVHITVGQRPTSRIFGTDRFEVAVKIADVLFPSTAPVVFVASGANYPDALSAGPAAAKLGGPLLLTLPDRLPDVVRDKILALHPSSIVVVGGVNSVSQAVEDRLITLVPGVKVERVGGADRYAVSRGIADRAFGDVPHAYVATGANFPDALSAGAAAGAVHEPVVLVNGNAASADQPTLALFASHKASSLTIVGGVNSVSTAVETSLAGSATVNRIAGADRYEASSNLNHAAFTKADTVYLATGMNYPDALAGSALAGMTGSPLYVVPQSCVPTAVLDDITRLGAKNIVLLGGPNSLTDDVAKLTPCAG